MASTSLADSPQSDTANSRALRGLALFRERGDEIEPLGKGRYHVPSCNGHDPYTVDLGIFHDEPGFEACTCRDFQDRKETCVRKLPPRVVSAPDLTH
jgi:hypothetical protein